MERGNITITRDTVHVALVGGTVWLSQHQIADLFGMLYSKVNSNIRSIFKNKLLWESDVMHTHHFDGGFVELYNLEMITMLAFRFESPQAEVFRKWAMRKLSARERTPEPPMWLQLDTGSLPS